MYTLKTNNRHAPHPVSCTQCGRKLRRNAHNEVCATCHKLEKSQAAQLAHLTQLSQDLGLYRTEE